MSIHTDRAFNLALGKGAAAAGSYETWTTLMNMPKRELAEIAMHLASSCTGSYGEFAPALARLIEERDALKANNLI